MKKIVIDIYDESDGTLNGLIEINSEEYGFMYVNNDGGSGLQCAYDGGTDEYRRLRVQISEIANAVRNIEEHEGEWAKNYISEEDPRYRTLKMAVAYPMTLRHAIKLDAAFGDKAVEIAEALDKEGFQFTNLSKMSVSRAIGMNNKFEKAVEKVMQDEV